MTKKRKDGSDAAPESPRIPPPPAFAPITASPKLHTKQNGKHGDTNNDLKLLDGHVDTNAESALAMIMEDATNIKSQDV